MMMSPPWLTLLVLTKMSPSLTMRKSEIDNQGSSLFHVPLTIAIKLKPKRRENSLHFTHTNVISMALPPTSKRKRQLKLKENSFRGGKIRGRLENVYRW
ncbi:uncharacterized protein LOC133833890 isoform X2 [Humulus lupulus]|uniref:uncharacterized protein LOC133833890 isoform X2 n=1 Tax=Humulus lupulus TaxID=3486 RepID=UPI002B4152DB|nr:uncharacterized protein LOC133833890 isoform X2 [Humulus lupulus]